MQKFRDWKADHATVLDTTVEAALKSRLTNLMQDLVAYKRSPLVKQDATDVRGTTWEDAVDEDIKNTMNDKKVDNEFVSKKGNTEFETDAESNMGFAPEKFKKERKTMRLADTEKIPELRDTKSVPYGSGKEQELTHGGKVVKKKVLESGNFGGTLGNSDYEFRVGKKIGDKDTEKKNPEFASISKIQTQRLTRLQTQPSNAAEEIYLVEQKIYRVSHNLGSIYLLRNYPWSSLLQQGAT